MGAVDLEPLAHLGEEVDRALEVVNRFGRATEVEEDASADAAADGEFVEVFHLLERGERLLGQFECAAGVLRLELDLGEEALRLAHDIALGDSVGEGVAALQPAAGAGEVASGEAELAGVFAEEGLRAHIAHTRGGTIRCTQDGSCLCRSILSNGDEGQRTR
ncbi:MAG: hypothetical protein IPK72_09920 [Candidatus Eisenbacteria bacterium]|nr:hypothetical protein [Candidatus Eisenbacteria bacterium]